MNASEAIEVLKRCRPDEMVAVDLANREDVESPAQQQLTGDWQRHGESFFKDDMTIQRDLSIQKLLLTVPEVGHVLAISRSKVYELLNSGSLASVSIGRSRRIRVSDVEALVNGGGHEY